MHAAAPTALTSAELDALRDIAGTMVPADAGLGMPGADDPAIFADMVKSIGRDLALVRTAIAGLAAVEREQRENVINDLYARRDVAIVALGRVVLAAYYRDDRVLIALGHEARAPFPKGYTLEQGDWSLLDAVRNRPPLWRHDR